MNPLDAGVLGVALGFSLTIPPGPMNALIASRSMRSFRSGVTTGLGAMSADAILGAIVYLIRISVDLGPLVRWIEGVGAVVLAVTAYRIAREGPASGGPSTPDAQVYSEALVVGLTNPLQILWWVTAGLAFAYFGGAALFIGLFVAIGVWILVFPYTLREAARRDARIPKLVSWGSTAFLLAFAAYFALSAGGVVP